MGSVGRPARGHRALAYLGIPAIAIDYLANADGSLNLSRGFSLVAFYEHMRALDWKSSVTFSAFSTNMKSKHMIVASALVSQTGLDAYTLGFDGIVSGQLCARSLNSCRFPGCGRMRPIPVLSARNNRARRHCGSVREARRDAKPASMFEVAWAPTRPTMSRLPPMRHLATAHPRSGAQTQSASR